MKSSFLYFVTLHTTTYLQFTHFMPWFFLYPMNTSENVWLSGVYGGGYIRKNQ